MYFFAGGGEKGPAVSDLQVGHFCQVISQPVFKICVLQSSKISKITSLWKNNWIATLPLEMKQLILTNLQDI